MARKTKLTREEVQAKAQAKRERADQIISNGLDQLTDPAQWTAFLTTGHALARYSVRNQLLIWSQNPAATDTAGYTDWQHRGRQVREGEGGDKAIWIFAPVTSRQAVEGGKPVDRKPEPGEDSVTKMRGCKVVSVFDISQTDPIDGREFKPAPGAEPKDIEAVRAAIAEIAGEHAEAILDALDEATGAGHYADADELDDEDAA